MQSRQTGLGVAGGVVMAGCFAGMLGLGDFRAQVPSFLGLYGLTVAGYGMGVACYRHLPVWMIVAFGVVFRLVLLPTVPSLSDDVYRYLWDGRVQVSGVNPYWYAPVAEDLAFLRDEVVFPHINHAHLPTIYPPLAQIFFFISYLLTGSLWGIKVLVIGADCATAYLVMRLLQAFEENVRALLVYFWHPLVVIECAGSAHIDIVGVGGALLALFFFLNHRDRWAFVGLGGAVLIKFFPLAFAPAFWRRELGAKNVWGGLFFWAVLVLGYLPYAWSGAPVFGSLGVYAANWEFNSPVFDLLRTLTGDGQVARWYIGVAFAIWVGALFWRRLPPLPMMCWTTAAFLVLTPTLHPWYALWLVPFLAFERSVVWIAFTLLLGLSYHVLIRYQAEGVWGEAFWVRGVVFGVPIGLWLFFRLIEPDGSSHNGRI